MSDSNRPISDGVELLSSLQGELNGSLAAVDRQRMEDALQQHPDWQEGVVFDQLWKDAMQNQKPKLDNHKA